MTDRPIPERKIVKGALREIGFSNRQIDALLRRGWRGLIGETEAELIETREALKALQQTVESVK